MVDFQVVVDRVNRHRFELVAPTLAVAAAVVECQHTHVESSWLRVSSRALLSGA